MTDQNEDGIISLQELLRVVQFYNTDAYHCAIPANSSEDGYEPGPGDETCTPYTADLAISQDWVISLSELLRVVQIYNSLSYFACAENLEDGFCLVPKPDPGEGEGEGEGEGGTEGEGEGEGECTHNTLGFSQLDIGEATGNPGNVVIVALDLLNTDASPATATFSILFDLNILTYNGFVAGSGIGAAGKSLSIGINASFNNRLDVVLTDPAQNCVGVGSGQFATLAFTIAPGTQINTDTNLSQTGGLATYPDGAIMNNFSVTPGVIHIKSASAIAPTADFTSDYVEGLPGVKVRFEDTTDLGSGLQPQWLWNFGDGETSTEQNPIHIYETAGTYDVSLQVTTTDGADTETKPVYMSVITGVRRFVRQSATGNLDGLSWNTAFTTIQEGIDSAADAGGGEVWVAQATYSEQRSEVYGALVLAKMVNVYGGFAGTETLLGQRDFVGRPTIIDGIASNDFGTRAKNVVWGADNCILDGFTIRNGNATGSDQFGATPNGGGILNEAVSPRVFNCIFSGNLADKFGAGVYNVFGYPEFTNCTFQSNQVNNVGAAPDGAYAAGGGAANENADAVYDGCTFQSNSATANATWQAGNDFHSRGLGGGMYSFNANVVVRNSTFNNNAVNALGTGFANNGGIISAVRDEAFGGGIYHRFGSLVVDRCTIINSNATTSNNGAFAVAHGGGLYNEVTTLTLTNSVLFKNNISDSGANTGGAGLYIDNGVLVSTVQIVANCSIVKNTSDSSDGDHGGGVYVIRANPDFTNCVFWNNSGDEVAFDGDTANPHVNYSDVEGGFGGTGNINADPLFLNISTGNLQVMSASPLVDAGRSTATAGFGLVTVDRNGQNRGVDGNVAVNVDGSNYDIGAFEFIP